MRTLFAAAALSSLSLAAACDLGGGGGGGGKKKGPDAPPPVDATPYLDEASAAQVGRAGADLRIHAIGRDADGDAVALSLRLVDAHGDDAPAFDADFDGVPESGSSIVPFDASPIDAAAPDVVVTLAGLASIAQGDASAIAVVSVEVAFVDATGEASSVIVVDVTPQEVRNEGEACDPSFVADRCADALGCKAPAGSPAGSATTCRPGGPPVIAQAAYFRPAAADAGLEGPRLLVSGADEDGDAASITLTLFDADGNAVALDTDGDTIADTTEFSIDIESQASGAFFASLQMGVGLEETVASVHIIAVDAAGLASAESIALLSSPPPKGAGQACSAEGFDACASGTVCSPGDPSVANTCQSANVMRNQVCVAADHIDVVAGAGMSVEGDAGGASLWDAPAGCSPNDPKNRPEGVVVLTLSASVSTLSLTTDVPATGFDTVMYVVSSCNSTAPPPALGCGDDGDNTVCSSVTLHDVPAGTYAVVVDSFGPAGGHFGLAIDAE